MNMSCSAAAQTLEALLSDQFGSSMIKPNGSHSQAEAAAMTAPATPSHPIWDQSSSPHAMLLEPGHRSILFHIR